jgi:hypothetical protein
MDVSFDSTEVQANLKLLGRVVHCPDVEADTALFMQIASRAMREINTVRNQKGHIAVGDCCTWVQSALQ